MSSMDTGCSLLPFFDLELLDLLPLLPPSAPASPAWRLAQTWGVSSDTQMKAPARASSVTMTSFFIASSSHGTALSKLTPSWDCASLCTPFRTFDGSNCQRRSSSPPERAMSWTSASPAGARTLECSLETARRSNGNTKERRKMPVCCRPKAESQRANNLMFAAKHLGPRALSLRSFGALPDNSAPKRSSIRFSNGKASSSSGTRPWSTQEQSVSAAACCGDEAVLDPPPASVWSSSASRASGPQLLALLPPSA
mmetsp:Transcript_95934/g.248393  ORF Transcript_95934/g.248393 Transcript_95934/m.248393 type:complete len:254 (-) Transcript_95934:2492-3253(-)